MNNETARRWSNLLSIILDSLHLAGFRVIRRYCGSLLGLSWSLLSPIVTIAIYYLVFRIFFKVPVENFPIYLSAGLLPWICMSDSLTATSSELLSQRGVLENNTCSPLIFLLAIVLSEWCFLIISYVALIVVMVFAGLASWKILALPVFMMPLFLFVTASCIIIGYVGVHFRDTPHLLKIFLAGAFWLVPIVYHWSLVPSTFAAFIQYNPFSILIAPSQVILHGNAWPSGQLFFSGLVLALAWMGVAAWVHCRASRRIIYYL